MAPARPRSPSSSAAQPASPPVAAMGDLALAVDAAAIVAISALICTASHQLALMTFAVPLVVALRFVAWGRLPPSSRVHGGAVEAILFGTCLLVGAFNDYSSVVRHEIYRYTAPHYFPSLTTIPLWMLLYWGLIVRSFVTLCRWRRLDPLTAPRNLVARGLAARPWLKVGIELGLVVATRQAIYRLYDHAWWSWLPFALALAIWLGLLRPRAHDWKLLATVAVVGPAVEVVYIQVGGLHRYELGWLGGVPVWIALWWMLAILILDDLSLRGLSWAMRLSKGST